jgi:hypothetical protein
MAKMNSLRTTRRRPSPALLVSAIALFVALGGTSYAALHITGAEVANGSLTGKDIENRSLKGSKELAKNSVGGSAVKESSLGKIESAARADIAGHADSATHADSADRADNAAALGGKPASAYLDQRVRGLALAGAVVDGGGTVKSWFNRAGSRPTVSHTAGSGDYHVTFPGINVASDEHIVTGTAVGLSAFATVDYSGDVHVRTYVANIAADTLDNDDRTFTVLIHEATLLTVD